MFCMRYVLRCGSKPVKHQVQKLSNLHRDTVTTFVRIHVEVHVSLVSQSGISQMKLWTEQQTDADGKGVSTHFELAQL